MAQCWAEGCAALSASACGRCRTAEYCGAPCQRAHWRAHKPRCSELEAAAHAAEAAAADAAAAATAAAASAACAGGGAGGQLPGEPRAPGVYSGLECRVQDYRCALAGCGAALGAGGAGAVCSGCRAVVYCDVECQAAHWAAHLGDCYVAVCARVQSGDAHKDDEGGEYVLRCKLRECRAGCGESAECTLDCMNILGVLLASQGRLAEAGSLLKESLAGRRAALGPTHEATLESMSNVASLLRDQGNLGGALQLFREVLDSSRATLGPRHDRALTAMNEVALMLDNLGRHSEAEALFKQALSVRRAMVGGPQHPETLRLNEQPGGHAAGAGQVRRGSDAAAHCHERPARHPGLSAPRHAYQRGRLCSHAPEPGQAGGGRAAASRGAGDEPGHPGRAAPRHAGDLHNLAVLLEQLGQLREAETLLNEAMSGRWRVLGPAHLQTQSTLNLLVRVLTAQGKVRDAADVKAQYRSGM